GGRGHLVPRPERRVAGGTVGAGGRRGRRAAGQGPRRSWAATAEGDAAARRHRRHPAGHRGGAVGRRAAPAGRPRRARPADRTGTQDAGARPGRVVVSAVVPFVTLTDVELTVLEQAHLRALDGGGAPAGHTSGPDGEVRRSLRARGLLT